MMPSASRLSASIAGQPVCAASCDSSAVIHDGHDDTQPHRQRYRCKTCTGRFDDLTGTVLAGHHQPLRVWVLCLYFMGLNLSNRQIAAELGLGTSDVQAMTEQLRGGLVAKVPAVTLQGEVEIDKVYVVAGHKGQSEEVAKRVGLGDAAGWQERRAELSKASTAEPLKRQRRAGHAGEGQATHPGPDPARGSGAPAHAGQRAAEDDQADHHGCYRLGHPDQHRRVWHLRPTGTLEYGHKTVCRGRGEYARDEDGDGFCEVHVNTIEGFWSLLRSWPRPHRGILQKKLPDYPGFFQFVHNARRRGRALLGALIAWLVERCAAHHPGTRQEPPGDAVPVSGRQLNGAAGRGWVLLEHAELRHEKQ